MTPEDISTAAQRFRHDSVNGKADLRLVFDITLYLSHKQLAWEGIVDFYNKALVHLRDHVRFYAFDGRSQQRNIEHDTFDALPFWASEASAKRNIYGLLLRTGRTASEDEASEHFFEFYHDCATPTFLRMALPPSFALEGSLVETVVRMASQVPFLYGTAGFAALKRRGYASNKQGQPVYALSRRFLCVDFGTPLYFSRLIEHGIKSVSWLTFVGRQYANALGSLGPLQAVGVKVHQLSHGWVLQAGDRPILGDVNCQQDVSLYRVVNRFLRQVRFSDAVLGPYSEIGGNENTRTWLHRFDE